MKQGYTNRTNQLAGKVQPRYPMGNTHYNLRDRAAQARHLQDSHAVITGIDYTILLASILAGARE